MNAARRIATGIALSSALLASGGLAATSAQAAGGCLSQVFCAFPSENYGGTKFSWGESNSNWNSWAIANDDDSWSNLSTTYNVRVFKGTSFGGDCEIRINKGDSTPNASYHRNDNGESHKRDSATIAC